MKIAVIGINGKMGKEVATILRENNYEFFGISREDDFSMYKNADILIEFTNSKATIDHVKAVLNEPRKYIIGTTGFSDEELRIIGELSNKTAVFLSYNFSYGLNVLLNFISELYKKLLDYDVALYEVHHRFKKDKPSGTAKMILNRLKDTNKNLDLEIASFRIGGVFGEHVVMFSNEGEIIEIKHKAISRKVFAIGVLKAIEFMKDKERGLFGMEDII